MSVLGRILERGIKNWPISKTGYQFWGKFVLERGANLESRAAHTHQKNTQVPPPPGHLGMSLALAINFQWLLCTVIKFHVVKEAKEAALYFVQDFWSNL